MRTSTTQLTVDTDESDQQIYSIIGSIDCTEPLYAKRERESIIGQKPFKI